MASVVLGFLLAYLIAHLQVHALCVFAVCTECELWVCSPGSNAPSSHTQSPDENDPSHNKRSSPMTKQSKPKPPAQPPRQGLKPGMIAGNTSDDAPKPAGKARGKGSKAHAVKGMGTASGSVGVKKVGANQKAAAAGKPPARAQPRCASPAYSLPSRPSADRRTWARGWLRPCRHQYFAGSYPSLALQFSGTSSMQST